MKSEKIVLDKVEIVCKADSDTTTERVKAIRLCQVKKQKSINDMGAIVAATEETIKEPKKQQGLSCGSCNSGVLYEKYLKYVKLF